MSGVFGIVDPTDRACLSNISSLIARAMSHRDWYVTEWHVDDSRRLTLGRIGIGIFNRDPQPVWNANHTIAVAMAGEFYDTAGLCKMLGATTLSHEQIALALYEREQEAFVKRLNGFFVIAIWDGLRGRMILATDRFATYNVFYSCRAGRLIFAPEMKGVLCDPTFPRKLDMIALAQYMRFQHLLGNRTFFEDIHLLPPASVLTYDTATSNCDITTYWSFGHIKYQPSVGFNEAVEEGGRLLRRAVERQSSDAFRPGVYLSGGLDSRVIAGMVSQRPVVSLTYGVHNCRDVIYAEQIARAVGSDHHWFDLPNGDWVRENVDFHLELTEGYHSWIHSHGISTLPAARQLVDFNLSGWDGASVMGYSEGPEYQHYRAVDDDALLVDLFNGYCQKFTWPGLTEAEEQLLYCDPTWNRVRGLAFESLREEFRAYRDERHDIRAEIMYIRNHCGRLTHNLVTFFRSHIEMRFPFFDTDLVEFMFSLPAPLLENKVLYRAVLQCQTPRLTYIPWDDDEFLPTTRPLIRRAQRLWIKARNRVSRYASGIFPQHPTLYADYEGYLRNELRPWAEAILLDSRTEARGLFEKGFVRSLMKRHLSGQEMWTIGKIAPLITYEMMLRRFCD